MLWDEKGRESNSGRNCWRTSSRPDASSIPSELGDNSPQEAGITPFKECPRRTSMKRIVWALVLVCLFGGIARAQNPDIQIYCGDVGGTSRRNLQSRSRSGDADV